MERCIRVMMVIILLCIVFLAGCNKGGNDNTPTSPATVVDPAEGSDWDSMVWDKGKWG